jgi:hypothetical protein
MAKATNSWDDLFRELVKFRAEFGHCSVPAQWEKNPQLGRWVAVQRYRHKLGELPAGPVAQLEKLGFVWSASDNAWQSMFDQIVQFRQKHGHCDVPTQWPENPHLANWVANQRHRKKRGTLSAERVRRLDSVGFLWAAKRRKDVAGAEPPAGEERRAATVKGEPVPEERLYHVGVGVYVQHNGVGKPPARIERYVKEHGELPPYIPLPALPTEFRLGGDLVVTPKRLTWPGKGPLPADVLDFVCENGVLPPRR